MSILKYYGNTCKSCRKWETNGKYYDKRQTKAIHVCTESRNKSAYNKPIDGNTRSCKYYGYSWYITTVIVDLLGLDESVSTIASICANSVLNKLYAGPLQLRLMELLRKYDLVGPILAESLAQTNDIKQAEALYTFYIAPCEHYINIGEEEKAIIVYKKMLNDIIDHFQTHDYVISEMYDVYERLDNEVGYRKSMR